MSAQVGDHGPGDDVVEEEWLWELPEHQHGAAAAAFSPFVQDRIYNDVQLLAPSADYHIPSHLDVPAYSQPALLTPFPVNNNILASNDGTQRRLALSSTTLPRSTPSTSYSHFHIQQINPWENDFPEQANQNQEGFTLSASSGEFGGFGLLTSEATSVAMNTEVMPVTTYQRPDNSYTTLNASGHWPAASIQLKPPPTPDMKLPLRSIPVKKARSKRTDPISAGNIPSRTTNRRAPACWRCRKYRKPCDDELVCNSCQVGNFRVWPPALGCRRDNLQSFAHSIIPLTAEDLLRTMPLDMTPQTSWRLSVAQKKLTGEQLFSDPTCQKWSSLAVKVHATGLFGREFPDLLNILDTYQSSRKVKNPVLEAVSTLVSACCEFYGMFVISASIITTVSPQASDISAVIHEIRASMARSLSLFLKQCVSSNRADWFPSVLAFAVFVASIAMFMDAAVAMPAAARTELWDDVGAFCKGLRAQLYPTALDLLRIRANNDKQMAPLKLNCWDSTIDSDSPSDPATSTLSFTPDPDTEIPTIPITTKNAAATPSPANMDPKSANTPSDSAPRVIRNPKGMRLVGNDPSAFDGFQALQAWLETNEPMLKQGKILFSNDPFTSPTVEAICTLAPIFGI